MQMVELNPVLLADEWFGSLPVSLQQSLAAAKVRRLCDGQLIHGCGEKPQGLFCLLSGKAKVCGVSRAGKELLLTILLPGNWFGITSVLDGAPHTHDIYADGEVELLQLPRPDFDALLQRHPEYGLHFARWAARQLRSLFAGVEDAQLMSLDALLAKRILNLASVNRATAAGDDVTLALSQTELAHALGITRQSISKRLTEWEASGYVRIAYGRLVLLDIDGLRGLSESVRP
ncbi:MAG: Crp/Fnr family transcriptional regulator [Pseudomonadota bacterium]